MSIDEAYLGELQEEAEAAGKCCVVGGLVLDERGRVFVQKRAEDRRLFPGCWDIVGGHVETGESLYGALEREIREETGWQLRRIVSLLYTFDWSDEERGTAIENREFDFLVEVDGDLDHPELEWEKFSEYRWVDRTDAEVVRENRKPEDEVIYRLVVRALEVDRDIE